jgi:fimbrial chaperone protein
MMRPIPALAALIALVCLQARTVQAAALEISPVMVTFASGQTATTIELKNGGEAPVAIQGRSYRWTQSGDEDTLTPTQEIILSPPIFTVPAGASQTMRLLLRGGSVGGGERSYRLLLDEVPPADIQNKQIAMALRVSLPVMVALASSAPAALQWRAGRGPGGETQLSVINSGSSYDRVSMIEVTLADGSHPKVIPRGGNPYILPGATRDWIVQGHSGPPGPLQLKVLTQAGKSEQLLNAP